MTPFDRAVRDVLGIEGTEDNDPDDLGGHTRFGITEGLANKYGYEIGQVDVHVAKSIYYEHFWSGMRVTLVADVDEDIAAELFEQGVNIGTFWPGYHLQRILNVMNNEGKLFPDLTVDGIIGTKTISALKAYLMRRRARGKRNMLFLLNALQAARYLTITEARQKNEKFFYGWIDKRTEVGHG